MDFFGWLFASSGDEAHFGDAGGDRVRKGLFDENVGTKKEREREVRNKALDAKAAAADKHNWWW